MEIYNRRKIITMIILFMLIDAVNLLLLLNIEYS
jgi:hypothetical protein